MTKAKTPAGSEASSSLADLSASKSEEFATTHRYSRRHDWAAVAAGVTGPTEMILEGAPEPSGLRSVALGA